jgi:putative peptidoglycan lipid II flippase
MGLMQRVDHAGRLVTHFDAFGHTVRFPMEMGAPRRLDIAQFMYQFPLGVFAIALATAIFPKLSEGAFDTNRDQFRGILRRGIEASLFIGLPASLGLVLVSTPAVRLLFERGEFTYADTVLVARSTALYSGAIWAFSLQQILNRAYYALHDTTTPLILALVNLLLNLAIELPLLWTPLAESGMAMGTLIAFSIQAVVMVWMLDRQVGGVGLRQSLAPVGKMLIATAAMGVACVAIRAMPFYPSGESKPIWLCQLIVLIGVGGLAYFAACAAMGMDVTQHFKKRR